MSFLVGPVSSVGHPFVVTSEIPVERRLITKNGEETVYAFHTRWLYADLRIEPAEPFEAVILWDPGWMRSGEGEGAINEIQRAWDIAQELDVPVIGVYSDWFASWKTDLGLIGTLGSLMFCDAIITDPAGSSSLRVAPPMRVTDPLDYRYRPISTMDQFLTYGRLPHIGGGENVRIPSLAERDYDVTMVSTLHPQNVVLRPYYVEKISEICEREGWSFEFHDNAKPEKMEELYLDSKVVANVSLGTQANYRVYEALACGSLLVTDGWNIGMKEAPCFTFVDEDSLERALVTAMTLPEQAREEMQRVGVAWATRRSPVQVWSDILARARELVPHTVAAREARRAWREEMNREKTT